jgi:GNAT superfamily N-acetyltransferase
MSIYRRAGRSLAPSITVAEAKASDAEALRRRFSLGESGWETSSKINVVRWVARHNARVVGLVTLVDYGPEAGPWQGEWVMSLMVWGPYRRLGLGERLTRAVIGRARAAGAEELRLAVFDDNAPALRLYGKMGFVRTLIPELESKLAQEAQVTGRRRVTLALRLDAGEPADTGRRRA